MKLSPIAELVPYLDGLFDRSIQGPLVDELVAAIGMPTTRKQTAMLRYCRRHGQARKIWSMRRQRYFAVPSWVMQASAW